MADSLQNFNEFVQSLSSARPEQFSASPGAQVESPAAFEAMREYLITRYQGLEAQHSFVENGGQVVDCIPVEQQPSLRGTGHRVATPPQALPESPSQSYPPPDIAAGLRATAPPQLSPGRLDRFGNQMSCPDGTIPMIRLTLEQLSRFKNLQEFFRKAPGGGQLPTGIDKGSKAADPPHKYAHASQTVGNIGGTAFLNVWKPQIGANQIFSLSQHWYVAGSGSGLQTAECGWQVFPQLYGTDDPCLFIYWTRDAYASSGCYNLSCDAFVQTDSNTVLGGTLAFSTPGPNTQIEYQMGYLFFQGNWWFYFNNQPVGYYPGSIYQGGALSSGVATVIDFGGETDGGGTYPPMGSGAFASNGPGFAAVTH